MQTTRPHFIALCISFSTGTPDRTARHTRTDRSAEGKGKAPAHRSGTGAFHARLAPPYHAQLTRRHYISVRTDALLDHFGDDLLGLVERDHDDGIGIGRLEGVNLSREVRRIGSVELLERNLATRLGEELLHVVGESLTI